MDAGLRMLVCPDKTCSQSREGRQAEQKKPTNDGHGRIEGHCTHNNGPELRLLLLGPSRVGKSSLGNMLLGYEAFDTGGGKGTATARGEVCGQRLLVVDTYGWRSRKETGDLDKPVSTMDREDREENMVSRSEKQELLEALKLCDPGPHAVLLVLPLLPLNHRESAALLARMRIFTPAVWRHTILVFTLGDKLISHVGGSDAKEGVSLQGFLEAADEPLQGLLSACYYRCAVVNNLVASGSGEQRAQAEGMLTRMRDWVAENGDWHFSLLMYCRLEEEWRLREREARQRWENERERETLMANRAKAKEISLVYVARKRAESLSQSHRLECQG